MPTPSEHRTGSSPSPAFAEPRLALSCVALAGGVGGARLADGLYRALEPGRLTVVVNTADDFTHLGLRICPDLDTVMYTLAGIANPRQGWGIEGDTRSAMDMLSRYGAPDWFLLTDGDLGTHVWRTHRLGEGVGLAEVTQGLADRLGIRARLLPMAEAPVGTIIVTPDGRRLPFQEYFVKGRQAESVAGLEFEGMDRARVPDAVVAALQDADVLVWCPSNPFVSIGPILAVPGMREAIAVFPGPRVAVSPIVGGQALKGPAARMLASLGHEVTALGVARLYRGLVDTLVIDPVDAGLAPAIETLGMQALVVPSIMHTPEDRLSLALAVLGHAAVRRGQR